MGLVTGFCPTFTDCVTGSKSNEITFLNARTGDGSNFTDDPKLLTYVGQMFSSRRNMGYPCSEDFYAICATWDILECFGFFMAKL